MVCHVHRVGGEVEYMPQVPVMSSSDACFIMATVKEVPAPQLQVPTWVSLGLHLVFGLHLAAHCSLTPGTVQSEGQASGLLTHCHTITEPLKCSQYGEGTWTVDTKVMPRV